MSSALFAILAIGVAGFLGASGSGDSQTRGGMAVVFITGFILLCAVAGYMIGVNPGKIMTICGLALAAWFVIGAFAKGKK